MGTKLSKAPVFFALAQVTFDEQLRLDETIAKIQEKFKEAHFPVYKKQQYIAAIAAPTPAFTGSLTMPDIQLQSRHMLGTLDQSSIFILERNGLTFTTTRYEDYDAFATTYFGGLSIVHEILGLSYVERIGTRYLDAVIPQEGETIDQYLVPQVLGTSHLIDKPLQHAISETVFSEGKMKLVVRTITQNGVLGVPIELGELMPRRANFPKIVGLCASIDTDAGAEDRIEFNLDVAKVKLKELHDEASAAFKKVVTPLALDRWK